MPLFDKVGNASNNIKVMMEKRNLENRKDIMTRSANQEIEALYGQIYSEQQKLGDTVYRMFKEGEINEAELKVYVDTIDNVHLQINEKKKKLNDILQRYNEEIAMLDPFAATKPNGGENICGKCGEKNETGSLFCSSCGTKLG